MRAAPRQSIPSPARILLAAGLVALPACAGDAAPAPDERRPPPPARRIHTPEWTSLHRIGGTEQDTTVLMPGRIAADAASLYLLDVHGNRVTRFDHEGRRLWSWGRPGAGPDELSGPRDLQVDAVGRAWVLDPPNARATAINPDGFVHRRVPLDRVGYSADDIVPLPGDEILLLVADPDRPLVRIAADGSVLARHPFPWPGFASLDPMLSQVIVAGESATGRWAAAFQVGDGFFTFHHEDWLGFRGWFAEPVPFPRVRVEETENTVVQRLERPRFAAWSVTLSSTRLYVLFAGESEHRMRIIDSFSLDDGAYIESFLLPRRAGYIAYADGSLYVTYSAPFPAVERLRPVGVELP